MLVVTALADDTSNKQAVEGFSGAQAACFLAGLAALATGAVKLRRQRTNDINLHREDPSEGVKQPRNVEQERGTRRAEQQPLPRRRCSARAASAELFEPHSVDQLRRAQVPWPSPQASAVKREVLRSFPDLNHQWDMQGSRRSSSGGGAAEAEDWQSTLRNFPDLVLQACLKWRVTLLDLEALVLPSWGFDVTFSSRATWLDFVGEIRRRDFLGEIQGLRISLPDSPDARCHIQSARWVELLDGTVLARLMTDGRPTCVMPWAHPRSINAVLAGTRKVAWSPERSWMYPQWHKDRMVFLSWVGKVLKLNPAWTAGVLPFLPIEARRSGFWVSSGSESGQEQREATRRAGDGNPWRAIGQLRPVAVPEARVRDHFLQRDVGQRLLYRSTTHRRWISCTVTRRDATSGSIMIDAKPGYWITPREQVGCIRAT